MALVDPFEELLPRRRTICTEYLAGDVRIDDRAHLSEPQRLCRLFHEESAIVVRSAQYIAFFVDSE